jgi:hypothetical protein
MTPLRMCQPKVLGGLGLFDLQLKITTQRLHLFFKCCILPKGGRNLGESNLVFQTLIPRIST